MANTISKDLQDKIERQANAHCRNTHRAIGAESWKAYIAGATAYAHYKERFEQAKKALEGIADSYKPLSPERKKLVTVHCPSIESLAALLASWKEEGKEGGV